MDLYPRYSKQREQSHDNQYNIHDDNQYSHRDSNFNQSTQDPLDTLNEFTLSDNSVPDSTFFSSNVSTFSNDNNLPNLPEFVSSGKLIQKKVRTGLWYPSNYLEPEIEQIVFDSRYTGSLLDSNYDALESSEQQQKRIAISQNQFGRDTREIKSWDPKPKLFSAFGISIPPAIKARYRKIKNNDEDDPEFQGRVKSTTEISKEETDVRAHRIRRAAQDQRDFLHQPSKYTKQQAKKYVSSYDEYRSKMTSKNKKSSNNGNRNRNQSLNKSPKMRRRRPRSPNQ